VDIPSYRLVPGQKITLKESSRNLQIVLQALEGQYATSDYVSFDKDSMTGTFVRYPQRNEILQDINEQLIVEFYNR
jgi:small subunit ribosomal protein S4